MGIEPTLFELGTQRFTTQLRSHHFHIHAQVQGLLREVNKSVTSVTRGAGSGGRTRVSSLEGWRTTVMPCPHICMYSLRPHLCDRYTGLLRYGY